jgi:plasmid stabilization system protein ParE
VAGRFLGEVARALSAIDDRPLAYAVVHKDVRRALLRRFPYAVFFVVEPGRVVVLAVLHQARDPERWRMRT